MRNDVVRVTGPVNWLVAALVRHLTPDWARNQMPKRAKLYRAVPEGSGAA